MSQEAAILKALSEHTQKKVERLKTLNSNQIKARFGRQLYNFLIIDPEEVNQEFRENYLTALSHAEYAEASLQADLQGCTDKDGLLALLKVEDACHPGNLDLSAQSFLDKPGRAPRRGVLVHPDDTAKDICKISLCCPTSHHK
ncbi:hypothetical protein KC349_g1266 [Hortaea werneckii]|nr:hypothetical protein KC349_g1266 [Hortaea werneckii]